MGEHVKKTLGQLHSEVYELSFVDMRGSCEGDVKDTLQEGLQESLEQVDLWGPVLPASMKDQAEACSKVLSRRASFPRVASQLAESEIRLKECLGSLRALERLSSICKGLDPVSDKMS